MLLTKIKAYLNTKYTIIYRSVFPDSRIARVVDYKKNKGDTTLRLNYPLSASSLIFDVGGYEGQWAQNIYNRYQCQIHIFEPVKKFAEQIKHKFKDNQKIFVYDFGLGGANKNTKIVLSQDGSSTQKTKGIKEIVNIIKISDFIKNNNLEYIDLMKINIEGDEYDLLDDLIASGLITIVKNVQVQFHNFVPNAKERMEKIQNELTKTHHLTYQYKFVWENWEINNIQK